MVRHLRRVVVDPKLVKRVPPNSLDGFLRAEAAGTTLDIIRNNSPLSKPASA
jgi:hypothetical protein